MSITTLERKLTLALRAGHDQDALALMREIERREMPEAWPDRDDEEELPSYCYSN